MLRIEVLVPLQFLNLEFNAKAKAKAEAPLP